ncbi:MAG TPA: GDSL-type esterase/lipase family protein, partial [Polyangiales bacterium]|nr:GDSL-type esterase/lipase family protein [Polyangiales bacterium]
SRARYHLLWDDALYREHLARRKPDLVVIAYGTNEAGDDLIPITEYETDLLHMVSRVRETVPQASCLLIGPSDRPTHNPDHTWGPRPRTDEIVQAQRRVAAAVGCGFFDLVTFMGGPMSMMRWVHSEPPWGRPDHVHFTRLGYEALGNVLHDALLAGYEDTSVEPISRVTAPSEPSPSTLQSP